MNTASPLEPLVRKLNRHVALGTADCDAIRSLRHSVRDLPASAYLLREDDKPGDCAVLLHGIVFRQKMSRNGARQIVALQFPGDPLDLQHLFLDCADHSVQALTDIRVAMVPRIILRDIAAAYPAIARAFAIHSEVDASIAREWLLNTGRRSARERLAHLLCEVAARLDRQQQVSNEGYELPMTQEQLGDALSLTSVHVNRTIRSLEQEGLISRHRRKIFFRDWASMREVAGFRDSYLHLGQQAA